MWNRVLHSRRRSCRSPLTVCGDQTPQRKTSDSAAVHAVTSGYRRILLLLFTWSVICFGGGSGLALMPEAIWQVEEAKRLGSWHNPLPRLGKKDILRRTRSCRPFEAVSFVNCSHRSPGQPHDVSGSRHASEEVGDWMRCNTRLYQDRIASSAACGLPQRVHT